MYMTRSESYARILDNADQIARRQLMSSSPLGCSEKLEDRIKRTRDQIKKDQAFKDAIDAWVGDNTYKIIDNKLEFAYILTIGSIKNSEKAIESMLKQAEIEARMEAERKKIEEEYEQE